MGSEEEGSLERAMPEVQVGTDDGRRAFQRGRPQTLAGGDRLIAAWGGKRENVDKNLNTALLRRTAGEL